MYPEQILVIILVERCLFFSRQIFKLFDVSVSIQNIILQRYSDLSGEYNICYVIFTLACSLNRLDYIKLIPPY